MGSTLPSAENKDRVVLALAGSIVMALLVFLLIPITQYLDTENESILEFRETVLMAPPPPVVIPPAPEQVEQTEPETPPEFERQIQELSINQLELSLNPGISDALKIGIAGGAFTNESDSVSDIKKLFTFDDLPQAPRIINQPNFAFPRSLIRRGIKEGKVIVKIVINPQGRARILEVLSATNPELIPAAKDVIRQARFTPPKVDGVPREVHGEWPIVLHAP